MKSAGCTLRATIGPWLGAALLVGCSEDRPSFDAPELPGRVVYDFVAHHDYAERWSEVDGFHPGRLDHRRFLTDGWSFPSEPPEGHEGEIYPLWSDSETAEISFFLREIAARRVTFSVVPLMGEGETDPVPLEVSLNGERLASYEMTRDATRVDLDLPVASQRVGTNRLQLDFGRVTRPRDIEPGNADYRRLSAHVGPVHFSLDDPDVRRRLEAARAVVPDGTASRAEWIEQVSGSRLSYYLEVPEGARLGAHAAFLGHRGTAQKAARFRLTIQKEGSEATDSFDGIARADEEPRAIDADLSSLAGSLVRIDFIIEAIDGSAEPVAGAWIAPALRVDSPESQVNVDERSMDENHPADRVPVVLVLLDACSASYLSCYGGREGLTPNVDRLATEGTLFERAYSQASYTVASVATALSGRYTWEHGAWSEKSRLLEGVETWPEAFRAAGYRTVGITHSPNGSSLFDLDRGFENFDEVFRRPPEGRETPMAEQVLPALEGVLAADDGRPLMLWIHLVEPHEPYRPPAPFAGRLASSEASTCEGNAETLWSIREWRFDPTPADLERLRFQYEENLGYVDDVFGRIRDLLAGAGILEECVLAVFSDHGEGFLEHEGKVMAGMGHGTTVYEEMTRIPMIVRLPGAEVPRGKREKGLVALVDLLPTIAELTGVPGPVRRGRSFLPSLLGPNPVSRDFVLSHSYTRRGKGGFLPAFGAWYDGWKYVHSSGDAPELYDLTRDPGERDDQALAHPVVAGYMRQRLHQEIAFDLEAGGALVSGSEVEWDEEALRQMRALGYVR